MQDLIARAEKIARLLKHRGESVAVAESSTGGLIAAALLALPGASAYFLGGAVVYTQAARRALLDVPDLASLGMRPPLPEPEQREPGLRLAALAARGPICSLRLRRPAEQSLQLALPVVGEARRRLFSRLDESQPRLACFLERISPGAVQLHQLGTVHEAASREGDQPGLLGAPAREGVTLRAGLLQDALLVLD